MFNGTQYKNFLGNGNEPMFNGTQFKDILGNGNEPMFNSIKVTPGVLFYRDSLYTAENLSALSLFDV